MMSLGTIAEFGSTVTVTGGSCPSCSHGSSQNFYSVDAVPVHQVRLMRSREAALDCPKGDIRLHWCEGCGFVWNEAFDPDLVSYYEDYESTQAISPTFNRFHTQLANELVERYGLAGKDVFEIGSGQGEFLNLICDLGVRHAYGFDPVLRSDGPTHPAVDLIKDWYSEAYAALRPDFVCSKMVMEHIPDPGRFLTMLRRTIGDRPGVTVFAMMPELHRILRFRAFWDIYYEHCSYFSLASLAHAFRVAGFDPVDVRSAFGDQYALIAARPSIGSLELPVSPAGLDAFADEIDAFSREIVDRKAAWKSWVTGKHEAGQRVVIWGGGSKGVAFLTTLGLQDEIAYAVDLNEKRHGTYIAGTGQCIMGPNDLTKDQPDVVLIMSPIYREEIGASLRDLGLNPRLVSIEDEPWYQ